MVKTKTKTKTKIIEKLEDKTKIASAEKEEKIIFNRTYDYSKWEKFEKENNLPKKAISFRRILTSKNRCDCYYLNGDIFKENEKVLLTAEESLNYLLSHWDTVQNKGEIII